MHILCMHHAYTMYLLCTLYVVCVCIYSTMYVLCMYVLCICYVRMFSVTLRKYCVYLVYIYIYAYVSSSLFQQFWFLMKSLTRLGQLGHQKERQWIAPFIPGGVGVAALILRWKQTTVRKIQKTSQCFTLLCLFQPFSAVLVSHEITHASWPTRPSKRKAMNCPVYPKSTVSKKNK